MLTTLSVLTPPVTEPVNIEDAKLHLHIVGSAEDVYLTMLITQCRQELEQVLRRSFLTQTLLATFTLPEMVQTTLAGYIGDARNYVIELVHPPVQSVTTVEIEYVPGTYRTLIYSIDPLLTTDYFIQPGTPPCIWLYASAFNDIMFPLEPNYISISGFPTVRVTYVTGYPVLPQNYVGLLLQLVAWRFYNREDMSFPSSLLEGVQGKKIWRL